MHPRGPSDVGIGFGKTLFESHFSENPPSPGINGVDFLIEFNWDHFFCVSTYVCCASRGSLRTC